MQTGGSIQNVVIIVGGFGVQRGPDAVKTGIGDGTGDQTGINVGVVGAVNLQIFGTQRLLVVTQSIEDGGIDIQIGGSLPQLYRRL